MNLSVVNDGSKSIRPNVIAAVISKFTNYFDLIKEKECWRLHIKKCFIQILDADKDVLTYWKNLKTVEIYTSFDLVLTHENVLGFEFYGNLETENIEIVEKHLTRMAAFLLSTQHFEETYKAEFKKEQSRIKVAEVEKDFK